MGSLLGGSKPPPPPKIQPPAPMPDESAIQKEKAKQASMLSQQSGRSSTVLSGREGL